MRSLLFVPADSERKIASGLDSSADALILDLEDSVVSSRKAAAREICAETLAGPRRRPLFVRIQPLTTEGALLDLAAVVRGRPTGIVLPKCRGASDLRTLDRFLSALEVRDDVPVGDTAVIAIVTETARSLGSLASYRRARSLRVHGLTWGGEDLAGDLGALTNRDADGRYPPVYEFARTFCVLAAAAAAATAIDAVYTDYRDPGGLKVEAESAVRDGFSGKLAVHPAQLDVINEVFTPTLAQAAWAERVVAAFDAEPNAGAIGLDGKMLDRPHHRSAMRLLARVASLKADEEVGYNAG